MSELWLLKKKNGGDEVEVAQDDYLEIAVILVIGVLVAAAAAAVIFGT